MPLRSVNPWPRCMITIAITFMPLVIFKTFPWSIRPIAPLSPLPSVHRLMKLWRKQPAKAFLYQMADIFVSLGVDPRNRAHQAPTKVGPRQVTLVCPCTQRDPCPLRYLGGDVGPSDHRTICTKVPLPSAHATGAPLYPSQKPDQLGAPIQRLSK